MSASTRPGTAPAAASLLIRDALVVRGDRAGTPPFVGWVAVGGSRI